LEVNYVAEGEQAIGVGQEEGEFSTAASEEMIQHVAEKIRERNIEAVIVEDGDEARRVV
jgi:hypothetical protein